MEMEETYNGHPTSKYWNKHVLYDVKKETPEVTRQRLKSDSEITF